ncbi:MAG: hypothetical protein Q7T33_10725 [Dehalococcoidia bacterium]|nr:hypothetical protein [Dehalococcoidia bacterium]
MLKLSSAAIGLIAALILLTLLAGGRAGGYELLANGGFEDGVTGWSTTAGTLDSITDPVHGGARAAQFNSAQQPASQQVYQWPLVQGGQAYELSGWVLLPDAAIDRVFLRISWFDAGGSLVSGEDSLPLSGINPSYRFLTTGPLTAPDAARSARVAAVVITTGASLLYLDEFSLQGLAPLPVATASPLPPASATPSLTPAATASPDATPSATRTATPSATPTATPTASPTSTSTPTPAHTPTHTPTAAPTPAPALTQTPPPTSTPPPSQEPAAFPALANGGFEELREDGTPYGWRKVGGAITADQAVRFEGQYSLALTSATASTKWAYQTVAVQGGDYYRATAQALAGGPGGAVFLRISWYESDDGSGEAIDTADSTDVLQAGDPAFRLLTTGPIQAPAGARSARVRLMLRPASADQAVAYFDAVAFSSTEAPAPSAPPTAPARPSPTPTPTVAAAATPAVTVTPPSAATPTPAPPSAPTSAPSPWPDVFPALANGGFEEASTDGAPYAWRKAGGEMSVSDTRAEGARALAFRSETAATKWAYQTVLAEGGTYYRASVQALKNDAGAAAVFLRLSWYAGEEGSGEALASADSGLLETDAAAFRTLSVDARAPADARSVKVKLMLRPRSDSPAVVFFDDASFVQIPDPPPAATPSPSPSTAAEPPAPAADQPDAAADSDSAAFDSLLNGGFEEWDGDGTARGWRHTGGEVSASERAAEGAHALALTSRTGSTKWAYQALLVEPGAYYQASAQALAQDGATAFLRLSWYESEDGSGGALSSADSTQALGASVVYAGLATGPLEAPADARSVKLRLMLRPASSAVTAVYFDAVAFARVEPAGTVPVHASSPAPVAAAPAALGRAATPALPANVKPRQQLESGSRSASGGGGGHGAQWVVVILAVALPSAGLAAAAGYGIARRGMRQG